MSMANAKFSQDYPFSYSSLSWRPSSNGGLDFCSLFCMPLFQDSCHFLVMDLLIIYFKFLSGISMCRDFFRFPLSALTFKNSNVAGYQTKNNGTSILGSKWIAIMLLNFLLVNLNLNQNLILKKIKQLKKKKIITSVIYLH